MADFKPSIENFIYCELFQNKTIEYYLARKSSKIRVRNKWADFFVVLFSTGGIMGWRLWDELPSLACAIIAVVSLIKLCIPKILPNKDHIEKMENISGLLFTYCNNLEKLLLDFKLDRIDAAEAQTRFYNLKETTREYDKDINEVQQNTDAKKWKEAAGMSETYLTGMFYEEKDSTQNCQ